MSPNTEEFCNSASKMHEERVIRHNEIERCRTLGKISSRDIKTAQRYMKTVVFTAYPIRAQFRCDLPVRTGSSQLQPVETGYFLIFLEISLRYVRVNFIWRTASVANITHGQYFGVLGFLSCS